MDALTNTIQPPSGLFRLLAWLISTEGFESLARLWHLVRLMVSAQTQEGIYELLDYETHLELSDIKGKTAIMQKRQRVRFLQNNICTYQDMAWGDGAIFAEYQCSPGVEVDRYDVGHRWLVLISLREFKNKGDIEEFNIRRTIRNGFTRTSESFQTEVVWRTRRLTASVIFPNGRHPTRVKLIEQNSNRTTVLGPEQLVSLPDGRLEAVWRTDKPRLYEAYILQWEW